MAMVDSSVGGKTAVNHPMGKNMIGAFYQPNAVLIDTSTLNSLPSREYLSGISEIIKYGLIRDAVFFEWLEKNMDKLTNRDPVVLMKAIKRSCENKAAVVIADEREGGIRASLNLGHTFGHAIENGMGYGVWLHGEAVATGIIMATQFSANAGFITNELRERIERLIIKSSLPNTIYNNQAQQDLGMVEYSKRVNGLNIDRFLELMNMDKKVSDGQLNLVLLKGELGECIITNKFEENDLRKIVEKFVN